MSHGALVRRGAPVGNHCPKVSRCVLGKIKTNSCFEYYVALCNAPHSGSTELFPGSVVEWAVEKLSRVLRNEAVRKAVSMEKIPSQSAKHIQFSHPASWGRQSSKYSDNQCTSESASGKRSSSLRGTTSSSFGKREKREEVLKVPHHPPSCRCEMF